MKQKKLPIEQTLIVIKPDAVQRGLIGVIFETLENIGLKLLAAKMVKPEQEVIEKHYPGTPQWLIEMGKKTIASFKETGMNLKSVFKTGHPEHLGQFVYQRLIEYWLEGPIIVSVWQGPHAIKIARKIRGHTIPSLAQPGTIHARYSYDSSVLSSQVNRVVKTFIHASGDKKEAEREIKYWFGTTKFPTYQRETDNLYL